MTTTRATAPSPERPPMSTSTQPLVSPSREQLVTKPKNIDSIDIEAITGGVQLRAGFDNDTIARYAEIYKADGGSSFPPIVVFEDGDQLIIADGHHRLGAAKLAKLEWISAIVKQGDVRAATEYALEANHDHGLPLTNADKRAMVKILLEDDAWAKWSDREISRRCRVSPTFVGELRAKTPKAAAITTRKDKHGVERKKAEKRGGSLVPLTWEGCGKITKGDGHFDMEAPDHIRALIADGYCAQKIGEAKDRGKKSPVSVKAFSIDGIHYCCVGVWPEGPEVIPIITAKEAKNFKAFAKERARRKKEGVEDYLGTRVVYAGADPTACLSTSEAGVVLVTGKAANKAAANDLKANAAVIAEDMVIHPTKALILAALHQSRQMDKDALTKVTKAKLGAPIKQLESSGLISVPSGLVEGAQVWQLSKLGRDLVDKAIAPATEPEVLSVEAVETGARHVEIAPLAPLKQRRLEWMREHIAAKLSIGKVGACSLAEAAALAVIVGVALEPETRWSQKHLERAGTQFIEAVALMVSHALTTDSEQLSRLPDLPDLCRIYKIDHDALVINAERTVTE